MNILEIKNLKKHFGGIKAVDDCDFVVEEGKITALIGPNGSGKSTIFNLISGLIKADGGTLHLCEKNITHKTPEEISNLGLSRVFQQSRLFGNLTIAENILLAISNDDEKFWKNFFGKNKPSLAETEKITDVLNLVGLEKMRDYQTKDLSFGQKRLAELARAIINPHQLLLLDEPVAGVNPKLRGEIADILRLRRDAGDTVLLIEHDMGFTLGVADRVLVLDEGKVIAQGTPAEIAHNPKVLEVYLS